VRALRCFWRRDSVGMMVDCQGIVDSLCRVAMNDTTIEAQVELVEALACYVSHAQAMLPYYRSIMDVEVNSWGPIITSSFGRIIHHSANI
jgi:hypothetical protein